MIKFKVFFISAFSILFFLFGVYVIPGIPDYLEYKNVADSAALSGNMLEAGRMLAVKPCVRDTPVVLPVECAASCPLVNATLKVACTQPVAEAIACVTAAGATQAICANEIKQAVECLACDLYYEVPVVGAQFGNIFLGIPKTFMNYKGGGTFPQPGMQFIWQGSSNLSPYVIGIPTLAAQRTKNVVDHFDSIITAIQDKANVVLDVVGIKI